MGTGAANIVIWFLQVEEQGIICTHDNTSFMVNKVSLAAYGSQDVQVLNGLSLNNLMCFQ